MMRVDALYSELNRAPVVVVNGNKTKELINVHYRVHHGQELTSHLARNFKLDYVKREIEWYIKGDRYDKSILDHAKIWAGCIGPDGGINSNYGQYLFGPGGGLARVIRELQSDTYSRRAVAMILGAHPLHWCGTDQPCTMSLQFLIREKSNGFTVVDCIATMRSQDAIFGLSNDVPAFMFILKVVASSLGLAPGALNVNVGSLHVYERHFEMVRRIDADPFNWYCYTRLPNIECQEAWLIVNANSYLVDSELGKWLVAP
jgi:thymidylate synthase